MGHRLREPKCRDLFTVIPRFVIEQAQAAAVTIMFGDEAALQQFNSRPPSTPKGSSSGTSVHV